MTLSAPPEQTLGEPLGRPGNPPSRRIARIAGIYLIVKGFRPSPVLYDDGLRAGVDGPLVPGLAAPGMVAAR